MVFPWIQFILPAEGDRYDESDGAELSDLMFLAVKEFGNKLKTSTSSEFTTTGVKLTVTPATGKTYYLHKAKVVLAGGGASTYTGEITIQCVVKMDGVVIDNFAVMGFMEEGAGEGPGWMGSGIMPETTVMGKSLDGNASKTVVVEVLVITGDNVSGFVTLSGWEEATGATPRLAAQSVSGGTGPNVTGDIAFLSKKTFGGKLVTNTGEQADGGTGNTATLTASSGKDLYLAKAKVTVRMDAATSLIVGEVTLVVNSVIKDRWVFSGSAEAGVGGTTGELQHEFAVQGVKVAATQTIVIDVVASDADYDITGTLVGFEETTGDDPTA